MCFISPRARWSARSRALVELLRSGEPFDYADVKALAAPQEATVPTVEVGQPDLTTYDDIEAVR